MYMVQMWFYIWSKYSFISLDVVSFWKVVTLIWLFLIIARKLLFVALFSGKKLHLQKVLYHAPVHRYYYYSYQNTIVILYCRKSFTPRFCWFWPLGALLFLFNKRHHAANFSNFVVWNYCLHHILSLSFIIIALIVINYLSNYSFEVWFFFNFLLVFLIFLQPLWSPHGLTHGSKHEGRRRVSVFCITFYHVQFGKFSLLSYKLIITYQ